MAIYVKDYSIDVTPSVVAEINQIKTEEIKAGATRAIEKWKKNNIPVKTGTFKASFSVDSADTKNAESTVTVVNDASDKYGEYASYVHRSGSSKLVAPEIEDFLIAEEASIKTNIQNRLNKLFSTPKPSGRIKL